MKDTHPMENAKSLQKFTQIKTPQDLEEHLRNAPGDAEEVEKELRARLVDNYAEKLCKDTGLVEMIEVCCRIQGEETNIRNTTYEHNHMLITAVISNFVTKERIFPTSQQIAKETGLSRQTVHKHLKEGSFSGYKSIIKDKLEFMATQALTNLYLIGVENKSVSALKAFIELSGAASNQPTVNNYIQINNLRLTHEDINLLPNSTLSRIERIISKDLDKHKLKEPVEV